MVGENENGREQIADKPQGDVAQWTLSRIDIRTTLSGKKWPVARVELDHPERGRVTDIGTAPGAFEAIFAAASHIVGLAPRLISFTVTSSASAEDKSLAIRIDVEVEMDGKVYQGTSFGLDLVRSSLIAWLDAVAKGSAGEGGSEASRARPFQVSGTDRKDDVWIFASSAEANARAIEEQFLKDGYSDVRRLT